MGLSQWNSATQLDVKMSIVFSHKFASIFYSSSLLIITRFGEKLEHLPGSRLLGVGVGFDPCLYILDLS